MSEERTIYCEINRDGGGWAFTDERRKDVSEAAHVRSNTCEREVRRARE